jgi:hypothetical protein
MANLGLPIQIRLIETNDYSQLFMIYGFLDCYVIGDPAKE